MSDKTPVLEVKNLTVTYPTRNGPVKAVDGVDLTLYPNEIMGLVGESGSGKSTMAYAIMRLLKGGAEVAGGSIKVFGQEVYHMNAETLRQFRWTRMSMVFQSAMNALNPVKTIEWQMVDMIRSHRPQMTVQAARERAVELFQLVRIDPSRLKSYPHQLSGGMRQRVVMAIAIALEPGLVIMDEPTTALDVVVQKSILDQIQELQAKAGFSILFISHDFSLVSEIADKIAIMYAGRIAELSRADDVQAGRPHHPYTDGLLRAMPTLTGETITLEGIPGQPPELSHIPSGCAFHPRCPHVEDICRTQRPPLVQVGDSRIECHLHAKVGGTVNV